MSKLSGDEWPGPAVGTGNGGVPVQGAPGPAAGTSST